jgi:hypothetical protein
MSTTSVPDLSGRRPPPLGGFNLTALNLEIRRLRRNPRAVIITVIVPIIFFFAFGLNQATAMGTTQRGFWSALRFMAPYSRPPTRARGCPSSAPRAGAGSSG